MRRELRPHQKLAIEKIRESLRSGHRHLMLQLPTGSGKTRIASSIAESAHQKEKKVLFIVPALSLIPQTIREFESEGIYDIGVIQGQHEMTDWSQPIQIASVQTLMRRTMPDVDIIIIDEAHVWFKYYEKMFKWADDRKVPIIGLSATPYSKGLGRWYDDLIIGATTQELIDKQYLCDFKVFAPSHPDLSKVRTIAGDYHEGDMSKELDKPKLVADVVDTWLRLGENQSTFCFGVDRLHAKNIQEKFLASGVAAEYMDCFTSSEDREAIFKRFADGDIRVICNVGVLSLGVDQDVRCLILAMGTKSIIKFVQIIGRVLRIAEAKPFATIIDHADNHLRLGFVTDICIDELDSGETRQKKEMVDNIKLPKECPKCTFLRPARSLYCGNCGWKPEPKSGIVCEAGDLVEMARNPRSQAEIDFQAKRRFYGELRSLAAWKGYQSGWCANQFREKYGDWPEPAIKNAPKMEPSLGTLSWVKSRAIRFFKSKEREQRQLKAFVRPEMR